MTSISSTSSSLIGALNKMNSSSSSTNRITGLYSGMDTDSLVTSLLSTEQAKLDRVYQNQTKLQWKYDAYKEINTQLKDFRTKYMSAASSDNVYSVSAYQAFKVNLASNNYVSVTTNSSAFESSHEITSVELATTATLSGAKYRSRSAALYGTAGSNLLAETTGTKTFEAGAGDIALKDLKYSDGTAAFSFPEGTTTLSFSINGKSFTFSQDKTLNDVMTTVNGDATANVTMSLTAGNAINFKSDTLGSSLNLTNLTGVNLFGDTGALGTVSGDVARTSVISPAMTLEEIAAASGKDFGFDGGGNLSFTINGQTFSFAKTQTLNDVMTAVNADATAKVTMRYDSANDTFSVRSDVTGTGTSVTVANATGSFFGASSPLGLAAGSSTSLDTVNVNSDSISQAAAKMGLDLTLDASGKFSFTINGKGFSFDASSTSVSAMIKKVNQDADAGVTMSYSSITDSFVLQSDETGSAAAITVSNGTGVNAFGAGGFFGIASLTATGTDAVMEIDGETVTQSTNTFTMDGMTFNLKASFDSTAVGSTQGSISFNVEQDIDSVITKVKNFVTAYNEIVDSLNGKISEKVEYDYDVLTEAQREELEDKDEEKWDEKSQSGLLRNDTYIGSLLSDMRSKLFQEIGDTGLSASDIGLSTGNYYDKGKISLNEDKLRSALETNPDAVTQVFVGSTTSTDAATIQKESGIITSFYTTMTDYANNITKNVLTSINDQLDTAKTRYSDLVDLMAEKEDDYYAKFATMETALSTYTSQSNWLTQQLNTL